MEACRCFRIHLIPEQITEFREVRGPIGTGYSVSSMAGLLFTRRTGDDCARKGRLPNTCKAVGEPM